MLYALIAILGVIVGIISMFFIMRNNRRDTEKSFITLSQQALQQNRDDFIRIANEKLTQQTQAGISVLDTKKQLIDQTLETIKNDLQKVERAVTGFDKNSGESFIKVSEHLKHAAAETGKLQETTLKLQMALADNKERGQWGERMAEDVLRFAGFVEGVNYVKQQTITGAQTRPDFTFNLPQDRKVNMDVKFPFTNYMEYNKPENEDKKDTYKQQFLKDVRSRIREIKTRDYINPEANTLDYVLLFIPNEQIYCFINENDQKIIDDALADKVILCSPFTLYAILAVIRQAMDSFYLSKTTSEIHGLLMEFNNQWNKYRDVMENLGRKIEATQEEYRKLSTTRSEKLEKPLRQIEELRRQQGIAESTPIENNNITVIPEEKEQD